MDVPSQRAGTASPFRMTEVQVKANGSLDDLLYHVVWHKVFSLTAPDLVADGFLFHDVAPLHLVSEMSLSDLKSKLLLLDPKPTEAEVGNFSLRAFRPNLVVGPAAGRNSFLQVLPIFCQQRKTSDISLMQASLLSHGRRKSGKTLTWFLLVTPRVATPVPASGSSKAALVARSPPGPPPQEPFTSPRGLSLHLRFLTRTI